MCGFNYYIIIPMIDFMILLILLMYYILRLLINNDNTIINHSVCERKDAKLKWFLLSFLALTLVLGSSRSLVNYQSLVPFNNHWYSSNTPI